MNSYIDSLELNEGTKSRMKAEVIRCGLNTTEQIDFHLGNPLTWQARGMR